MIGATGVSLVFAAVLGLETGIAVALGLVIARLAFTFWRTTPLYLSHAMSAAAEYERHQREGRRER